ncbi:hypothetical protein QAD02_021056 [Eretmocerus hayati]|uniref:Uncharacterized protein n=1 Tax=Eretmocerus hayati TaxID=131215 RepID=A0ACC2PQ66_9HYME|nr:hypothetical protein QAD02_021056 [Eretmocerus hayati]
MGFEVTKLFEVMSHEDYKHHTSRLCYAQGGPLRKRLEIAGTYLARGESGTRVALDVMSRFSVLSTNNTSESRLVYEVRRLQALNTLVKALDGALTSSESGGLMAVRCVLRRLLSR